MLSKSYPEKDAATGLIGTTIGTSDHRSGVQMSGQMGCQSHRDLPRHPLLVELIKVNHALKAAVSSTRSSERT